MVTKHSKRTGFTIVELLIVIVVIGILAAITIVAYNGIQARAAQSKINNDLALFEKAIIAARVNSGEQALRYVTLSTGSASPCMTKPAGTDLATLNKTTDDCWIMYLTVLDRISQASGINISNLVDPWGRPYALDENEKEGTTTCGTGPDMLGVFLRPSTGVWGQTNTKWVPYVTPGCPA